MAPELHSILGGSSSHRWLHCPASVQMGKSFGDTGASSVYAQEGTLAHALGELMLRKQFTEAMGPRTYKKKLKEIQDDPLYSKDMQRAVQVYYDYVNDLALSYPSKPFVALEQMVDYSRYAPQGFGTSDAVLIYGTTLHIIDYKHGEHVAVSAEDNPQLKLYALGAIEKFQTIYEIDTVVLHIVQPRISEPSHWDIAAAALVEWGETVVRPTAELALTGGSEPHEGEWCMFCPAKATCKARGSKYATLQTTETKRLDLYTDAEVGTLLQQSKGYAKWLKDLEEYALKAALQGRDITGWKAVAGRSNRTWNNVDAAMQTLQEMGFPEEMLYKPKEARTVAALEKEMGKSEFAANAATFVTKAPGKPTLAPVSDPRPKYDVANEVFTPVTQ